MNDLLSQANEFFQSDKFKGGLLLAAAGFLVWYVIAAALEG